MSDFIQTAAAMWDRAPLLGTAAIISLKACGVLAVTGVAAHALRRLSAAKRHMLWAAGIVAAVVLPLATASLPSWRIPVRFTGAIATTALAPTRPAVVALGSAATQTTPPAIEDAVAASAALATSEASAVTPDAALGASRVNPLRPVALFVIWMLGALLALWPWIAGVMARRRLERAASDLLPAPWERTMHALVADGHVPPRVRVLAAAECSTPMTWGIRRPIVLVPSGTAWHESERRNALLHEFAHVRRADYLTKLVSRVLCTIYWFNPLAWLAARAERLAREQACDDAVLRCGSRPSAYAQQLLEVAHSEWPNTLAVAALTMASRSNIARRLRAILDVSPDRSPTGRALSSLAAGAVCVLVPPLAALAPEWVRVTAVPNEIVATPPSRSLEAAVSGAVAPPALAQVRQTERALPQQTSDCIPSSRKRSSTNIQSNDGDSPSRRRWHVKWSDGACRIELDARGTFTLSPNADDLATLSSGGYFELLRDDGRVDRRVRIERGDGASLERTYWINGRRVAWDADAAGWFARTLVMLDRRTAFAVDTRLPMLLQRGGVEAVMDEVALMPSTYPQRVYYTKLFERQSLTPEQLIRVLQTASRNFDSGYEKAELLLRVAKLPTFAEPVHLAFAQMAGGIESDYEKRRAFAALLVRNDLKPEVVRTMLQATEGMKSDYELAELLLGIDRRYAVDESTRPYYVRALATIDSDYEQRRVLTAISRTGGLSTTATGEVIAIAGRTMKGYELAEFLVEISGKGTLDQATSSAFFNAAKNVKSDYERRRVLEALLRKGQLNREVVEGILTTAATIDGDYECAELLVAVSRAVKIDDALRPAYEKAAATIGGDYEYGRAMSAVRRSAQRN